MSGSQTVFTKGENPLKATKLNQAFSERLLRSGDTMIGPLLLSRAPASASEAATKAYVDGSIAAAPFTDAPNNAFSYGRHAGAWDRVHQLVFVTTNVTFDLNTIGGVGTGPFTAFNGLYVITNQPTGLNFPPLMQTGAVLHSYFANAGWQAQLFMGSTPTGAGAAPNLFYRSMTGQGTFGAWNKLLTSVAGLLSEPITFPEPTEPGHPVTRQYLDDAVATLTERIAALEATNVSR
jgi:hypothetical protein